MPYEFLGKSVRFSLKPSRAGLAKSECNKWFRAELGKAAVNSGFPCIKCTGIYKRYKRETYEG